ncbi:Nuclear pore complex protein NUP85 [Linum perenne]
MPRMRPVMDDGKLGECFKAKPDYVKAWERWRAQITKLDSSAFWIQCYHSQTREGLKNVLQIMLGNVDVLRSATCHWIELYVSHFLYIRPFTAGLESMYSLAQKCIQLKQASNPHKLMRLMIGILGENHEVVLAECSRGFGPWMVAHSMELLSALSNEADILLHEEQESLGGISLEELHRLVYAQVLSSHALTWQIAPIYLTSCMRQGMGLLEILLLKQSVLDDQLLLKNLEICRLYELDGVSSRLMEISGVYHWKHGRKGSAVFWLRQAQDEVRLNRIAKQLFDSVGKSISGESFKQWEGLIELLGSEAQPAGGLDFLHKYRDFKKCLQQADSGKDAGAARQAVESLMTVSAMVYVFMQFITLSHEHMAVMFIRNDFNLFVWMMFSFSLLICVYYLYLVAAYEKCFHSSAFLAPHTLRCRKLPPKRLSHWQSCLCVHLSYGCLIVLLPILIGKATKLGGKTPSKCSSDKCVVE